MGETLQTAGADHEAPVAAEVRTAAAEVLSMPAPAASGREVARLLATADAPTRARVMTSLQRTHGNAAIARFVAAAARPASPSTRVLARYSHDQCPEDFLQSYVWPGDQLARQVTFKAYQFVSADPMQAEVQTLLQDFFMTPKPDVDLLRSTFRRIHEFFQADVHQYECEEDCDLTEGGLPKLAYVTKPHWASDIHLCMPTIRKSDALALARDIIHELIHKIFSWDDVEYCSSIGCPESLSAEDAKKNPDSYANFALAAFPLKRRGEDWTEAG